MSPGGQKERSFLCREGVNAEMTREEIYRFYEIVQSIKNGRAGPGALEVYSERQIADAIGALLQSSALEEREACRMVAEPAAEPARCMEKGQAIEGDPQNRAGCVQ